MASKPPIAENFVKEQGPEIDGKTDISWVSILLIGLFLGCVLFVSVGEFIIYRPSS